MTPRMFGEAGLGEAGLGWARLGWARLGWARLGWARLGCRAKVFLSLCYESSPTIARKAR